MAILTELRNEDLRDVLGVGTNMEENWRHDRKIETIG